MFVTPSWETWTKYMVKIIIPSIGSTLRMVFFTMLFALVFGFILGMALYVTRFDGLRPNKIAYRILDCITNIVRSFPIIILIVAIAPLTKIVMGTTLGERAAIFPLTIAATPFVGKLFENAFAQVDHQLIEAARAFGLSNWYIIRKVIVKESVPSLISSMTLAVITYVSATTLAGAVGAGGLGSVALSYGYQSFNSMVLYTAVFILCVLVQIIQGMGNIIYRKLQ